MWFSLSASLVLYPKKRLLQTIYYGVVVTEILLYYDVQKPRRAADGLCRVTTILYAFGSVFTMMIFGDIAQQLCFSEIMW